MDSRFATAWFLGRWTVYGYRLKPYCLLHSMQLEAIGSPIECEGEVTAEALLVAAEICSRHTVLADPQLKSGIIGNYDFDEEWEKWGAYMQESRSRPALYDSRKEIGSRSLNAPWQQIIVTSLIRHTSIRRMEAWTMPEGQVLWEYHSLLEQIGDESSILSEEAEREMAEQQKREQENAEANARIMQALLWREKQIEAGLWPRTDKGTDVPFDPANPDHFPPE